MTVRTLMLQVLAGALASTSLAIAQTPSKPVAVVNGQNITEAELQRARLGGEGKIRMMHPNRSPQMHSWKCFVMIGLAG